MVTGIEVPRKRVSVATVRGSCDEKRASDRHTFAVYRSPMANLAVAAGLTLSLVNTCREVLATGLGALEWSWRVPIATTVGSLLVARALRRGDRVPVRDRGSPIAHVVAGTLVGRRVRRCRQALGMADAEREARRDVHRWVDV